MNTKNIRIEDYNYPLPDERIAKYPLQQRDHSKLLVYQHGQVSEDHFFNLPNYIPTGTLMVFNNTRVIQARLHFQKSTGAQIEVFLLEPALPADYEQIFQTRGSCDWVCMIGNLKKWKEGSIQLQLGEISIQATRVGERGTGIQVHFKWEPKSLSFAEIIDRAGELPIPPYLNRQTEQSDLSTYQTVYSKIKGSVAAPTAGLHFTESVLQSVHKKGIDIEEVTLHVGAGTFKPVKSEEIADHDMHTEYFAVKLSTIDALLNHEAKALAVGTTSVRTLESLYYIGLQLRKNSPDALHVRQWLPYENNEEITPINALITIKEYLEKNHLSVLHASTQIIIAPGYDYKIVKAMVTNFHQPKSTLLLLVSAFVKGDWKTIYQYALQHQFRFLSYGDSSILIP